MKYKGEPTLVDLLAYAAGLSVSQFVQRHTMLPYRRAIVYHHPDLAHGDPNDRWMLNAGAPRMLREGAYFCPRCVAEDITLYGMSYWHRKHQLPGVFVCSLHETVLQYSNTQNAFSNAPSLYLDTSMRVDKRWAMSNHGSTHVQTFIAVSEAFLASTRPFSARPIKSMLRSKAESLGIASTRAGSRHVRGRVIELFPQKWLKCVIPGILADKRRESSFEYFDTMLWLTQGFAIPPYLLAFGALFESSADALDALHASQEPEKLAALLLTDSEVVARSSATQAAMAVSVEKAPNRLEDLTITSPATFKRGCTLSLTSRLKNRSLREAANNFFIRKLPVEESANRAGIKIDHLELLIRDAGGDILPELRKIVTGDRVYQKTNVPPHELGYASTPKTSARTE